MKKKSDNKYIKKNIQALTQYDSMSAGKSIQQILKRQANLAGESQDLEDEFSKQGKSHSTSFGHSSLKPQPSTEMVRMQSQINDINRKLTSFSS